MDEVERKAVSQRMKRYWTARRMNLLTESHPGEVHARQQLAQ
jgi:hypothetical protein